MRVEGLTFNGPRTWSNVLGLGPHVAASCFHGKNAYSSALGGHPQHSGCHRRRHRYPTITRQRCKASSRERLRASTFSVLVRIALKQGFPVHRMCLFGFLACEFQATASGRLSELLAAVFGTIYCSGVVGGLCTYEGSLAC